MPNEYNSNNINEKILNLWKEFSGEQQLPTKLFPLLYNKFKHNQLLFIGLNPSFKASVMKSLGIESGILTDEDDVEAIYRWNNKSIDQSKVEMIIKLDSYAVIHHDYYKVLHKIASKLKPQLEMQAIDLFVIRQTKQKEVEEYIKISEDRIISIHPFFKSQIEITFELIQELKPQIIVVVNAFASKIIQVLWQSLISDFSQQTGYQLFKLSFEKRIPIFFSGMLSGQRALDLGSRERLVWHIQQSLNR
ncbi:MAG: hypothetical protein ACFFAU_10945 [Candidatus Hodarchaeota archaeon]